MSLRNDCAQIQLSTVKTDKQSLRPDFICLKIKLPQIAKCIEE
jgi:hypothetical protein